MNRIVKSKKKYLNIAIALLIVGLLIGASIPIRNKSGTGLEEATKMISRSILLSRQKAMAGETTYRIRYDNATFQVYRRDSDGSWVLDPPDNQFALPRNVQIASSSTPPNHWIVIDDRGTIDVGRSPVLLRLQDQEGKRLSIRISESGIVQEFPNW